VVPSVCASPPWSAEGWLALVRVELASDNVVVRTANDAGGTHRDVEVRLDAVPCDATATDARMNVTLGDARALRSIALRDIDPVARPRALAIAVAAVVRELLAMPPQPTPAKGVVDLHVTVANAPSAPPAAPPKAEPSLHATFAAETRVFGSGVGLYGGRLGVTYAARPWMMLAADAGGAGSVAHSSLGNVDVAMGSVGLGVSLAHQGDFGALRVGPRVEVGPAWFAGQPNSAAVRSASTVSPLVFLALSAEGTFRVLPWLEGLVGLDAGGTLRGMSPRVDQTYVADISGAYLSVRVGGAFGW